MIRQTITKGPIEGQKRKWTDRPMFDLTPSVLEVNEAARVFLQEADRLKRYTSLRIPTHSILAKSTLYAAALPKYGEQVGNIRGMRKRRRRRLYEERCNLD